MNRLVLLAVAAAVTGTLLAAFGTEDPTWAGRVAAVGAVAHATFSFGIWGWLVRASSVAVGLAVVLGAADGLLNRIVAPRRVQFDAFAGVNVADRVREVRARVTVCVERPKPDIIAAFDELVRGAIAVMASDIHMSPSPQG